MHDSIVFSIFLIFTGATLVATLALYARQALLVAYIALGLALGPSGLEWIEDPELIRDIADVGIIFLLFLLGLNLEPQDLKRMMKQATLITLLSSAAFGVTGVLVALLFDFGLVDSLLVGAAMMFSSTIIGLKLLPTTALHHQRMGEIIVSVLLLQDMLAIVLLLVLQGLGTSDSPLLDMALLLVSLPGLLLFAYYFSKHVITRLLMSFDQIKEYIFLLAIGWCLGLAELAQVLGLSHEIGAFIGGITLAANPIARYIAESLKPLRDFFLVMFFFALGAGFDISLLPAVAIPAIILALISLLFKPWIFKKLLHKECEKERQAAEIGVRLGQVSEFALLIAVLAAESALLSDKASNLIQSATIISFVVSSYWIVRFYPTPIATDPALRRD